MQTNRPLGTNSLLEFRRFMFEELVYSPKAVLEGGFLNPPLGWAI